MHKNNRVGASNIVPKKYAPLFSDWAFKKVFGNKGGEPLLMALLNDFLARVLPYEITSIKYLPTEVLGATFGSKKVIFDILCEDENGNAYLVEMQNAKLKNAGDRLRLYIARIQSESLESGDKSYKLPSAFFIGFLNYNRNKSEFYFTEECWFNLQTKEIVSKKDFRVFVELPKFDKLPCECESFRDKVIWLFKNLHVIEERPEHFNEALFDRIFSVIEISKLTGDDLIAYRRSMENIDEWQLAVDCAVEDAIEETTEVVSAEWYKKGMNEGRAEGISEGVTQAAKRMLEKGLDPAFVADTTGFPIEQIKALR
jgi:predicted transposase/invertase (TIGR01784 family)